MLLDQLNWVASESFAILEIFQEKLDGEKERLSKTYKIREEIELQHGTKRESTLPTKSEKPLTSKKSMLLEQNSPLMDIDFYLNIIALWLSSSDVNREISNLIFRLDALNNIKLNYL